MSAARLKASILANAQEIQRLDARVKETSKLRNRSPEDNRNWQLACEAFHSNYDALAFPGGYTDALERIASSQPEAVESALCFLEARPYFFRSVTCSKTFFARPNVLHLQNSRQSGLPSSLQRMSSIVPNGNGRLGHNYSSKRTAFRRRLTQALGG